MDGMSSRVSGISQRSLFRIFEPPSTSDVGHVDTGSMHFVAGRIVAISEASGSVWIWNLGGTCLHKLHLGGSWVASAPCGDQIIISSQHDYNETRSISFINVHACWGACQGKRARVEREILLREGYDCQGRLYLSSHA